MSKLDDKMIMMQKRYIKALKNVSKQDKKIIKIQDNLIVLYKSIIGIKND